MQWTTIEIFLTMFCHIAICILHIVNASIIWEVRNEKGLRNIWIDMNNNEAHIHFWYNKDHYSMAEVLCRTYVTKKVFIYVVIIDYCMWVHVHAFWYCTLTLHYHLEICGYTWWLQDPAKYIVMCVHWKLDKQSW